MRLVSVPGLGLDERSQEALLAHVQEGSSVRTQVVTLPGMGERGTETLEELAGELTRRVGPGEVLLLGHSASCQVVARAAKLLSTRGMVLVGPTTDPRLERWPQMLMAWARTAVHEEAWQVPLLARQYTRTGPVSMLRTMDHLRHSRIEDDLSGTTYPVLVVRGEHDRIATATWAERCVSRGGPGSRTVHVPGAHMVPLTAAPAVAVAVTDLLTSLGAESRRHG